MADDFYTDLRDNTVDPLMAQFGFDMTLESSREPTIDPNTGAITAAATVVSTVVKVIFRFFSQDDRTRVDILTG